MRARIAIDFKSQLTKQLTRTVGVRVDREVVLGAHTSNAKTVSTNHPVRYLEIEVPPHVRTGKGGSGSDGRLRLVTNLMDIPAELIAEAYRLRWLIEIYHAGYIARNPLYLLAA